MLNNEQCIEIAEKVLGMSLLDLAQLRFDEGGTAAPDSLSYIENYTVQLVNSWSGFGRTMQRMREHPNRYEFFARSCVAMAGYLAGNTGVNVLFEEHHLAALEAIK